MTDTYPKPEHGWTCFHCGETFTTIGAAAYHFGENPYDDVAACVLKIEVGGERGLIYELRKATNRARRLADRVEALEYQLNLAESGYCRIEGARNGHEAFMAYDFMEGRAVAAEALAADIQKRWPALVAAARRRAGARQFSELATSKSQRSATCIGCGCTDHRACVDDATGARCHWLKVDRDRGIGACSSCPDAVNDPRLDRAA